MNKLDYKKEYKDLYMPKTKPVFIDVSPIHYVMVEGKGDPNTSLEYKEAIGILYAISYTIKMSKMSGNQPDGYFEYVVPPLEGLWFGDEGYFDGQRIVDKNMFHWYSMIRLPEFVTEEYFEQVKAEVQKKKPELNIGLAQYLTYHEGLCVQIMHKGSYDEEVTSVQKMNEFIEEQGYVNDLKEDSLRYHHEIYLSDPRKTKVENLKTVIRHPIKKKS